MSAIIHEVYPVEAGDYTRAGEASADIKRRLKQLGVSSDVMRKVAVASYEVELNLVIHSLGGKLTLEVGTDGIHLLSEDVGPGIPDISLAMREGWSTASEEARSLGFGAGMGLPNMKRNADGFDIQSEVGKGTRIDMRFNLA
ncbi:MAG: anti-sigma regulatory factor [Clostridiales bacterium]|nr:anti-sigma regulatory factor [Clostridiales bacterium]